MTLFVLLLAGLLSGFAPEATLSSGGGPSTTGIDRPLAKKNIFDISHLLPIPAEMQQFDMDRKGNVYYAHVGFKKAYYEVVVNKAKPRRKASEGAESTMRLYYAGHPTSMDVEDAADGTYIWIPEFASKITSTSAADRTQYWDCQTFARIPYIPGASMYPWDEKIEHFYVGNYGDVNISLDFSHDILCVTYHKMEYPGRTRRIMTYRLSEAMALPLTPCCLRHPVTYGGDGAPHAKEQTDTFTIKAHDLRMLEPIAEFGIPTDRSFGINTWAWQGFEYYDGLVYFFEGTSAKKGMGNSVSALTIFDMDGNIVECRTPVRIAGSEEDLRRFGITTTGSMESEGVKVWKGALYLGFASGGFNGEKALRCNIFKYKLPKRQ